VGHPGPFSVGANAVVILVSVSPFQIWGKLEGPKMRRSEPENHSGAIQEPYMRGDCLDVAGPEVARLRTTCSSFGIAPRKTTG
jgi:hypothetical protein